MNGDFFTFSEYMKKKNRLLTPSMEDYVEMIYRLSLDTGFVRIHEISEALNVNPPSVTKMIQRLAEMQLIHYERYGVVTLKEDGRRIGELLLKRHNLVESFLRALGVKETILEETEKIEHTINDETLSCISDFLRFLQSNSCAADALKAFREARIEQ